MKNCKQGEKICNLQYKNLQAGWNSFSKNNKRACLLIKVTRVSSIGYFQNLMTASRDQYINSAVKNMVYFGVRNFEDQN